MVWRHGAPFFPVAGLSLLLHKVGVVLVEMAFSLLPGPF